MRPRLELDDTAPHRVDDGVVVGGHHHGGSGAVDAVEDPHDADRRGRIEVSGRLVGQQDQRTVDEGPGDRHTLLLTTGELAGVALGVGGQTDELEHLRHLGLDDTAAAGR